MENKHLIVKYFEKSLTKNEQKIFDSLVKTDIDFQKEFEYQKKVKIAITLNERIELKNKLTALEIKATNKSSFNKKWYAVAASILIICCVYFYNSSHFDSKDLYQKYYEPYPNIENVVSRGNTNNDLKTQAFLAYDSENYEKAILLFSELYNKENEVYAQFYKGISLIELQQADEAILIFENLQKINSDYSHHIKWYLSLCYLKKNEIAKAKNLLNHLSKNDSNFKSQATQLLNDLK